ncbi:unnamed protein product, partial [Linum tenue]
ANPKTSPPSRSSYSENSAVSGEVIYHTRSEQLLRLLGASTSASSTAPPAPIDDYPLHILSFQPFQLDFQAVRGRNKRRKCYMKCSIGSIAPHKSSGEEGSVRMTVWGREGQELQVLVVFENPTVSLSQQTWVSAHPSLG